MADFILISCITILWKWTLLHFIISIFTDMLHVLQKIYGKINITASKKIQLLKICLQKALLIPLNPVGYRATGVVVLLLYPSKPHLDILLTKISFPPIHSISDGFINFPPFLPCQTWAYSFVCQNRFLSLTKVGSYLLPIPFFQYTYHKLGWFFFWIHKEPCALCLISYLSGYLEFPVLLLLSPFFLSVYWRD